MTTPKPAPTIALVAVPGPGDHASGAGARAVADLLLRLHSSGASRYASFVERPLRIPTSPARVNHRSSPNVAPDLRRSIFAEQHAFLRTQLQYGGAAARDREEDSPDHQLMRAQLADYRSTGEPYDTVRLEGERIAETTDGEASEVEARLHIYELRWSDLSRLTSGGLRFVAELYQLVLHVAHLGRMALDHARLEHPASVLWRAYGVTHTWVVRLLTLFIPAVFVAMLATLAAAVFSRLFGGGLLAGRLAVGVWVLAAGGLAYLAFRAYERLRPGAVVVGIGAYTIAAAPMAVVAVRARRSDELLDGTLGVFELAAGFFGVAWAGVYLLGALTGVLGLLACARTKAAARGRAWRAARTAATTLAVAATLALTVTFLLWVGLIGALDNLLPARPYAALLPIFHRDGQSYAAFLERVLETTAGAGLPLLILSASGLAVMVALTFVPVVSKEVRPPRAGDVFQQRANGASPQRRDDLVDTDIRWAAWERLRIEGDTSQRLGGRVTRAFRLIGVAAVLLYVTVFLVAPAVSVAHWVTGARALAALQASAATIIVAVGGWLVAAGIAVVVFRGRLEQLTLGFRSALDAVLNVDNYLRTHPRESTPRARIAERYVSVLRYLCRWRDEGGPYDAIVLVAHSQGAVITADLLTFVQREADSELEALRRPLANGAPDGAGRRLFLFTAGNPLRQIYSEWFPHLFGWVRGDTGDGVSRPLPAVPRDPWMLLPRLEDGHRVSTPAIPDGAAPDPYAMGVTRWVNAYRSGDYIGRAQWRQAVDGCDWVYRRAPADAATRFVGDVPPITYVSEDAHRSRRELCIGAGAHKHYWDASAKAIAVELDLLITEATRLATRVAKDTEAPAEGMES